MPKIVANGINQHYWQFGKGPDIVMLHGLGGNLAVWHLQMVPEFQREYRVTTYDLRGHGRSDGPPEGYSTRDLAEDLLGLMDALGIEQAHLVGHSWGGDIALHFALLYPHRVAKIAVVEAGLIAPLASFYKRKDWEGWAYYAKILERLIGVRVPPEKRYDPEYLLMQLINLPIIYGPTKGQSRDEEQVLRTWNILKPILYGSNISENMTVANLAQIPHPTLLIYEENSLGMAAYKVLRDHLPNCASVFLPEGKLQHFTALERPELLAEHIRAFLQPDRDASLFWVESRTSDSLRDSS